ncbi:hypothetical protein SLS62_008302 [Diatrype stigma]|uniref:N-acetyltransferase domain-containing protein n=1 Tax=Diatrype stigma TaxID=117547 RepID=A0AAN9YL39_9PEZI
MSAGAPSPPSPPLGAPVDDPRPAQWPKRQDIEGRYVTLTPLDAAAHAPALYARLCGPANAAVWAYMPTSSDEIATPAQFAAHLESHQRSTDMVFYAIVPKKSSSLNGGSSDTGTGTEKPAGFVAYMNIAPAHRSLEIGFVTFAPAPFLQRTTAATEALGLMMRHAVEDLRYRRVEWKCDALNGPSRRAAQRLGFVYEGLFRQHRIVRGRNRDTAWFSVTDGDWTEGAVGAALAAWLDPANFRDDGGQIQPLEQIREGLRDTRH